jgi:hypothetical protein
MKVATVLLTMPVKANDATVHTYKWALQMERIAKDLGYKVVSIKGKKVTYDNVTRALEMYHPDVFIHTGHGCPIALNGYDECIVTRRYDVEELVNMDYEKLEMIMNPVKLSGCTKDICGLNDEVCAPLCFNPTNIDKLKNSIIISNACHSSSYLGRIAIELGVKSFVGYDNLLLFPVDTMKTENMFGEIHIELMKNILLGDSVGEAYNKMMKMEDSLIRFYKNTKWVGLPLLWNHRHRELLGNAGATVY